MKKITHSFTLLAIIVIAFLASCTKTEKTCANTEETAIGGYSGQHSILGGFYKFDDSLTVTNPTPGDNKITIKSEKLGTTLTGTFDPTSCGRVILDSISIPSQSILTVTLNNIRAGGYGIVNGNSVTTVINIKSGTATVGTLEVPLAGEALTGEFTKK